jgi:hypothetical protein
MGSRIETHTNDAIIPRRVHAEAVLSGAVPQTAANYGVFFIADSPATQVDISALATDAVYELISVRERHEVIGSDAGAVTVMVKKVPSGTAPAAGTDMLSAGISLKAAANTVQAGALSATPANLRLAPGDSIALVSTGVLTAVAGLFVICELRRI